jgi:hypothetical protein
MRSLAIALLVAAPAFAESLADWLPADALWCVGTPDLGRLRERAASGPLPGLWSEPALAPLRRALAARRREDVSALDLLALARGEVAAAGVRGATVGYVDCGERARLFDALLLRYHAQQARDLAVVETGERFLGHAIRVRRRPGTREVLAHVRVGSAVLFADDVLVLRDLLARRESGGARGPDLGDAAGADVVAWVAPAEWLRGWEDATVLGFDRVRSIVARVDLEPEGVRAEVRLRIDGELRGIPRLLARSVPGLGPPAFLPEDTAAAVTVSLDASAVLDELVRIRPDLAPALEAETRVLRDALGIDLRRDVLGALGDELTVALLPPAWSDLGSDAVPAPWGDPVIVAELRRPGAVEGFLRRIRAEEHDGVWLLRGQRFGAAAVIDGHLVLATRPGPLRRIRAGGPGILARAAFARLPADRSVFAFADLSAAVRDPLLEAIGRHLAVSAFSVSGETDGLRLTWFAGPG